jgi:hypothetical protein
VQDRLLALGVEAELVDELVELDAVERPAMRRRRGPQLLGALRQGDVEALLAVRDAVEQELQGERGLAGAGRALEQVEPPLGQAAGQDVVEPGDPGRQGVPDVGCDARCLISRHRHHAGWIGRSAGGP